MDTCEVCGNQYDKCFIVTFNDQKHIFDCFECAIYALAPICNHCKCKVIGHGVEQDNIIYCCAHCAKLSGAVKLVDRA